MIESGRRDQLRAVCARFAAYNIAAYTLKAIVKFVMATSTYQQYRVQRSLDRFHGNFGCESLTSYVPDDLVVWVRAETGLDVAIASLQSTEGKIAIAYVLHGNASRYEVITDLCFPTIESATKLAQWREQSAHLSVIQEREDASDKPSS